MHQVCENNIAYNIIKVRRYFRAGLLYETAKNSSGPVTGLGNEGSKCYQTDPR